MRPVLPLLLAALLSAAFAPAPLPRRDRETAPQKRDRELAALSRRLRELGVRWEVKRDSDGLLDVRYRVTLPGGGERGANVARVPDRDLPLALRIVIERVEASLRERN